MIGFIIGLFTGFTFGWILCALWANSRRDGDPIEVNTIPPPKYNIGDTVYDIWAGKSFKIQNCSYSMVMKKWYYYDGQKRFNKGDHAENNLKGMKDEI